ncbi:MAG: hypothetical protein FJY07_01335 [Bacteroidetes bacterium]|nr:hypothetical protein [Bacteroidota bacterium]
MKTNYLKSGLLAILMFAACLVNAAIFHSTTTGGNWNTAATWQEGTVPTATDDVVITGPGTVIVNGNVGCYNLTVNNGAVIQNPVGTTRTLTVNGDVLNNGTVQQSNVNFTLEVYGNITNNGIWDHYNLKLMGASTQSISLATGMLFELNQLNDLAGATPINALTDLSFTGTNINLGTAVMNMPAGGGNLSLTGGILQSGTVYMNSGTLSMGSSAKMQNLNLSEATFTGTVIAGVDVILYGQIINNGTFQNPVGTSSTCMLDCDFTNNGTVQNSNVSFTLSCTGDLINNGTWSNTTLQLTGSSDQDIACPNGHYFSVNSFTVTDAIGNMYATDNLAFVGSAITLNGAHIIGNNHEIYMTKKGTALAKIYNGIISDFTLTGTHIVGDQNVSFLGNIIVEDTLQNPVGTSISMIIDGDVVNNGIITKSTATFTINLTGDLTNNGIFTPTNLNLTGTANQNLSCGTGLQLGCLQLNDMDSTTTVSLISDVKFNGTIIDLNTGTMILPSAKGSNLTLSGSQIGSCFVQANNNTITFENNGSLDGKIIGGAVINNAVIEGTLIISGAGNQFSGSLTNNGLIKNQIGFCVELSINGNLLNNGAIQNSNVSWTIHAAGNITNNGTWSNSFLRFDGNGDQNISCLNGNLFSVANCINDKVTGVVHTSGELRFTGVSVNFNGKTLDASSGNIITADASSFTNITIDGFGNEFNCSNNTYFVNASIIDVRLYGTIDFSTSNSLTDVTNNGIFRNRLGTSADVSTFGTLLNNGSVQNGISATLQLNVYGNITNTGTWNNYQTNLVGTDDQQIIIIDNQDITGDVRFISNTTGSPYQWYLNSFILDSPDFSGETTETLSWLVPVSPTHNGTYNCQATGGLSRDIVVGSKDIVLDIGVYLEGPYNGTDMNTHLNTGNFIPLAQPYNTAPWNYPGIEEVGSIPNDDVVDWVLIELRDAPDAASATPATRYAMRAAFLLKNKSVVTGDGTSWLEFSGSITQNLFVVVWHRNHLGGMSAVPLVKTGGIYTYDFTTSVAQAYGTDAQTEIAPGVWGMITGNGNGDNVINLSDKTRWNTDAPKSGYKPADYDMNGRVNNQDKNDLWFMNSGSQSQVPE